jgi:tetratricopeptide (TPR) repeat protein
MSARGLEGYAPVDEKEAMRILTAESAIEADEEAMIVIASIVGCEAPALRWVGSLARTTGWRPLRQRLSSWTVLPHLVRESHLPWHAEFERARGALPAAEVALLATLSACDAPFAWDVLDAVEPAASIESICMLEEAGLLVRSTSAGVVTFAVPYCVRADHRLKDPEGVALRAVSWLEAWAKRAEELRRTSYGVSARATLAELASAVPLAERALAGGDPDTQALGLALWTRVSDAMFFANAIDFGSPAFAQAVTGAEAGGMLEQRVRARLIAGRASLEQGNPGHAESLIDQALALADAAERDDLRSETLRGQGWAKLASSDLEEARRSFDEARELSEADADPRGQADAVAGLGILALLSGDPETARTLLAEALATHVVTRDAPREGAVRGMMALLPDERCEPVDVAALSQQVEEHRTSGQRWREALVLARLGLAARARGDADRERLHLGQARAAAALSSMSASKLVSTMLETPGSPGSTATAIVVGFEGRSLALPQGESHDLTRHGPLRRMLWALAVAKSRQPGVAMTTLALVDAGWPGEKMRHEAATLRVYTTIRRLRALGLSDALVTRDDGYLLDPDLQMTLVPPSPK